MVIHKKRLGQHFLHDKNIINKIIKFVKPNKLDNFIEIGPGEGAITIPLIEKISKLILIEKDSSLIPILKDNLSEFQNITFINVMKPFDVFDGSINNEKVTKAILYCA